MLAAKFISQLLYQSPSTTKTLCYQLLILGTADPSHFSTISTMTFDIFKFRFDLLVCIWQREYLA